MVFLLFLVLFVFFLLVLVLLMLFLLVLVLLVLVLLVLLVLCLAFVVLLLRFAHGILGVAPCGRDRPIAGVLALVARTPPARRVRGGAGSCA